MQNPNNDGSALEKSSQEKFATLTKLIKETRDVDTADLVKLKQKRDELVEMLEDIRSTTSITSRENNRFITNQAEALIEKIDEKHLNATSNPPGMGMGSIASDLKDGWDLASMAPFIEVSPFKPFTNRAANFLAKFANKFITAAAPATNSALAATVPVASITLGSMAYLEFLARLADEIDKSLVYKMHHGRGGELGSGEMRKMFKDILARKPLIEASQKAPKNMSATSRDALMRNLEFKQFTEQLRQELELFPALPEQKEQWQSTQDRHEALQEYEEKGLDVRNFGKISVEAAQRAFEERLPKPGETPLDYLPPDMRKTKSENEAIIDAALAANEAARESSGYTQAAIRDKHLNNREDGEAIERAKQDLSSAQERAEAFRWVDFADDDARKRERAANLTERPATPLSRNKRLAGNRPKPAYTPPLGTEVIDPVSYLRDARENPLSYTPVTFREPARYIPTAAWAAMAAQPAAGEPNVTVTIERILPPPTHLADEDFRRCMQREIDQIVETFDTGVRG